MIELAQAYMVLIGPLMLGLPLWLHWALPE